MPFKITTYQPTPNPNALKCMLNKPISDRPRSYFNPQQAQADSLAAALFAIEGVTNLLINDDWITVNKAPNAHWPPIKGAVEQVLRESD